MKHLTLAALALAVGAPAGAAEPTPADPLAAMRFLVGSCWKGEFPGGKVTNTHCFEAENGGVHIRDRHVVEGAPGPYAGQTLFRWDAAANLIRYAYDASDGGHSDGTARAVEGGLAFEDAYTGPDGKPLTMRATWMRDGADAFIDHTEALENGAWKTMTRMRMVRVGPAFRTDPRFPDVRDSSFTEPGGSRVIRLSATVRRPAAEIWTALSTAEGWKRWAVKAAWVDFRVGGIIETSYSPDAVKGAPGNIRNEIVAYVPGRMLAIRNVQAPPDFQYAEEFSRTSTVIELTPHGDETEVVLTAAGYGPGAAYDALYEQFLAGDAWTLQNLKTVLEKP